jgi:8-oxo-dGTP pyrophosphatase MutT (NUDIX family)
MDKKKPFKITSSKIMYKNRWMQIQEDSFVRADGLEGIYGYLISKDSVMVTVLNDQQQLYLVYTYSYPSQSWNWELPGGNSDGEDVKLASQRELQEETGILANEWTLLGSTRVCNGFMTEHQATYLAKDLTFTGEKSAEDNVLVHEGKFFDLDEVRTMITDGSINDGQSITGITLLLLKLGQ